MGGAEQSLLRGNIATQKTQVKIPKNAYETKP
jgi:hypothetical protein